MKATKAHKLWRGMPPGLRGREKNMKHLDKVAVTWQAAEPRPIRWIPMKRRHCTNKVMNGTSITQKLSTSPGIIDEDHQTRVPCQGPSDHQPPDPLSHIIHRLPQNMLVKGFKDASSSLNFQTLV
jgi:hypothetical protein